MKRFSLAALIASSLLAPALGSADVTGSTKAGAAMSYQPAPSEPYARAPQVNPAPALAQGPRECTCKRN